jgi:hypothetical protein
MVDETDLSQETRLFHDQRAAAAVKNLRRDNMNAEYVPTRQEALATVLSMIPPGARVARGVTGHLNAAGCGRVKSRHPGR